ncbi:hypothetical protein NL676_018902 [Syzygium grande]|nr:hypothetical protein NL676_018902 [Syzygium grande]
MLEYDAGVHLNKRASVQPPSIPTLCNNGGKENPRDFGSVIGDAGVGARTLPYGRGRRIVPREARMVGGVAYGQR